MTTTLEDTFNRLRGFAFPETAESDDLADWMAELAEFDGHVAGIAATILSHGAADTSNLEQQMDELIASLDDLKGVSLEDRCIYDECKKYAKALKEVVENLLGQKGSRSREAR